MSTNAPLQREEPLTEVPAEITLEQAGKWGIQNTSSRKVMARIAQEDHFDMPGAYAARTSASAVGQVDSITTTTDTTKDIWVREEDVPRARELLVVGRRVRLFTSAANGATFTITDVDEDDQAGGVEFELDIGSIALSGTGVTNFSNITEFSVGIIASDQEGFEVLPGGELEIDHAASGVLMAWAINGPGTIQIGPV